MDDRLAEVQKVITKELTNKAVIQLPPIEQKHLEQETNKKQQHHSNHFRNHGWKSARRNSKVGGDDEEKQLATAEEFVPVDPLTVFFQTVEWVKSAIIQISQLTTDIERGHVAALAAATSDAAKLKGKAAEAKTLEANKLANRIRQILKAMDAENKQLASEVESASEGHLRMRRTQQEQLTRRFMDAMNAYQKTQEHFKLRYKEKLKRQFLIVNPNASSVDLDNFMASTSAASNSDLLSQQQLFSVNSRQTLNEMQERQDDIMMIEKSIVELHQLFVDMSLLVSQQGDLINQIEHHVAQAADYTSKADVEMQEAVIYQKKIWKRKWIMIGVGSGLLILIIIIIVSSMRGGGRYRNY